MHIHVSYRPSGSAGNVTPVILVPGRYQPGPPAGNWAEIRAAAAWAPSCRPESLTEADGAAFTRRINTDDYRPAAELPANENKPGDPARPGPHGTAQRGGDGGRETGHGAS